MMSSSSHVITWCHNPVNTTCPVAPSAASLLVAPRVLACGIGWPPFRLWRRRNHSSKAPDENMAPMASKGEKPLRINGHIFLFDWNIPSHLYVARVSLHRQRSYVNNKVPECRSYLCNSVKEVPELCSCTHPHKNSNMCIYICIDMYKYKVTCCK